MFFCWLLSWSSSLVFSCFLSCKKKEQFEFCLREIFKESFLDVSPPSWWHLSACLRIHAHERRSTPEIQKCRPFPRTQQHVSFVYKNAGCSHERSAKSADFWKSAKWDFVAHLHAFCLVLFAKVCTFWTQVQTFGKVLSAPFFMTIAVPSIRIRISCTPTRLFFKTHNG